MKLEKHDVQQRLCKLTASVMAEVFEYQEAADCFCGQNPYPPWGGYQFSEKIMAFVEEAVREKLAATQTKAKKKKSPRV